MSDPNPPTITHDSPPLTVAENPSTAYETPQPPTTSDICPTPSDPPPPTTSDPVPLCRHIREDGAFCRRPALHERRYCYQHLRLRGQQMRMARALAQRQPYRLNLPPLDDLQGVQAALDQVTRAMSLGLLESRRAGMILYALRQASCNLRFLAQAGKSSAGAIETSAKTGASQPGVISSETADQLRLVQEYPGFEAEFGLPPGLDLSLPPDVAMAAPNLAWPTTAPAPANPAPDGAFHSSQHWSGRDIEREQLEKKYAKYGSARDAERIRKINLQVEKEVHTEFRKQQEVEWQAEADRRNAAEDEKARQWQSMDPAQQRAFQLGVLEGFQSGQRAAEEELAKIHARKPAAAAAAQPQPDTEAGRA